MKKLIAIVIVVLFFTVACPIEELQFESTKQLSQWYDETADMEGTTFGPILYPLPDTDGITISRLTLEKELTIDFYFPSGHKPGNKAPVITMATALTKSFFLENSERSILTLDYEISWAHLLDSRRVCCNKL